MLIANKTKVSRRRILSLGLGGNVGKKSKHNCECPTLLCGTREYVSMELLISVKPSDDTEVQSGPTVTHSLQIKNFIIIF